MKKKLLLSAFAFSALGAMAQIADNSVAPDFTATDLNGNSQHLYDYLDQGYTVFIDVSATWCGPCWSYHNSGALEGLYDQYGPGTTEDKVMVFMVEGDASTSIADLNGPGPNSQGDWVTGTPYPILDNAGIADAYQITYFPTIFKVCPNRIVTEIGQKTTAQLWAGVGSCQSAVSSNDATLLPPMGSATACAGDQVELPIRLQNVGTSPLTNATIEARLGGNVLGSTQWTGNLSTYGIEDVTVTSFAPTANGTVTFEITSTDDNATNNTSTLPVVASTAVAPGTEVTLTVQTDNYGSETNWKLYNPDGTIFAQRGAAYANGASQPPHIYNWSLQDLDCYRFEITDAYGDGMCCSYGQGFYKITVNGNIVVQGASFAAVETKLFSTNAVLSVPSNSLDRSLNIYPNPTTGLVNLEYTLDNGSAMQVDVLDVVGKTVMHSTMASGSGVQREVVDLGSLANGTYVLKLNTGNTQATRTITLNK
ncbi:MAG: T9SS type A sorting domain-containing protein [Flavobacteriales bacterium]|nr:T9SS type A sorting domain-containing protein [Flavobacteriales bacterium]